MTTIKSLSFLCFLLTLVQTVQGQNRTADSLRALLANDKLTNERRVDLLNDLSYELYDVNDSAAHDASLQALRLAVASRYEKGEKYAYTLVGLGNLSMGNYKLALHYFRMSDRLYVPELEEIASYNLVLLGNTYRDIATYDSAEFFYRRALEINVNGDPGFQARAYKNMGQLMLTLFRNEEALEDLRKAETLLYQSTVDKYQLADIFSLYGVAYENLLDYAKAQHYFDKMCDVASDRNDVFHEIRCVLNRADLTGRKGDFNKSLEYCFEALKMSERYQYPPQMVAIYTKIGEVYMQLSQYTLASKYLFEGLKISEKLGLRYETSVIYSELAWINKDQLNFDLALHYINRSQEIREQIGHAHGISNSQNTRGLIYYQQKKYDLALKEFDKAMAIRKKIGHRVGVAATLYNSSLVYEDLGQLEKTYALQKEALAIDEQVDDKYNLGIDYTTLASLLISMNQLDSAKMYMLKGDEMARLTGSQLLLRNSLAVFSAFYEKKGDYATALKYQKEYQEVNDSIYSAGNSVKLAEMQALYQTDQKEQQIRLLNQQKQIQEDRITLQNSRIKQQYLFIVFVSTALVLVTVLAFSIYRYNKQIRRAHHEILEQKEEIRMQSEKLQVANNTIAQINRGLEYKVNDRTSALTQAYKELDTFFYRSSHDFRRPLTTFMGLAEVAKVTVKDANALELFDKVNETAHNLDKMLIKLQSISDVGAQQLVYKEVFLKEITDEVCSGFHHEMEAKGIKTYCEILLNAPFISYPAMVKIIVENLVENAINFCSKEDPFIRLRAYQVGDNIELEVSDNGVGIDPQYHDRIFDMYFRGNERSKGNGLGLYIVKKAVGKLHGRITFESSVGNGAVFRVNLPIQTEGLVMAS